MSVKSLEAAGAGGVVRSGYLKKLKTYRKKFFVLRAETPDSSARLEYYDSERKYLNGQAPKRSIPLKNCFNINRRLDIKHKNVIALYTKDDCFCVVLDSEEEVESWLKALLSLQHGEEAVDGETPKPTFEHVWQVTLCDRGIGTPVGLKGSYRLCLTEKTLSLIKHQSEVPQIELNLSNIRSCGSLRDFFYMEVGRSSSLGAGELWMETEDHNIAQNVHATVFHAMSTNSTKDELGPKSRNRSSSATESSKPNTMGRKQTHGGVPPKTHVIPQDVSQSTDTPVPTSSSSQHPVGMSGGRERCDSMPSRARTTSEGGNHVMQMWNNQTRSHLNPYRPQSFYGRDISHSPPSGSPVSPPSVGCSTDSAGSSYSLADETDVCTELDPTLGRYNHSLTPDEAIAEEDCPDSPSLLYGASPSAGNYLPMNLHSSDDGYVAMSPKGRHHNNSPTVSLSSVTSGTPSTDMRFAEYPLEKVTSYFAPSEDDDTRPARAYSVGSRPETYRYMKYMVEQVGQNDSRARAFSCGSKAKKLPGKVLPPHSHHPHQGAKSSSAPILSGSRVAYSSPGPMHDLMLMDFSRSNNTVNNSAYLDMTPGRSGKNSGYVEMKPKIPENRPDTSPYVDMTTGSPAKSSFVPENPTKGEYVDMDPRRATNHEGYIEMSFNKTKHRNHQTNNSARVSFTHGSPSNSLADGVELEGSPPKPAQTPDGYVEMTLGRGHHRQSSLDSAQVHVGNEDYSNIEVGQRRKPSKKEKARSQPIAILNSGAGTEKPAPSSGSSSPLYSLFGRKYSTGTPPTMHLPLSSPYSSLPRQRSRKNSNRRDSKDSSSSSVTTPSSSSTIFPISLNSPCSPVKPAEAPVSRGVKVPPAVLSAVYKKTTLPTAATISATATTVTANNNNNNNYIKKTDTHDYVPMGFERKKPAVADSSEYVNYSPAGGCSRAPAKTSAQDGDYAVMRPALASRLATAAFPQQSSCFRPINENRDDAASEPPAEPQPDQPEPPYEVLRTNSIVSENGRSRPNSASSELCSSSGSTVVGGSRPESVNSDRVRPASVSSADAVQLHYASLDLDEGNRSPRTVKNQGGAECQVQDQEPGLTYAAIDFIKSEGLKSNPPPNKVKH